MVRFDKPCCRKSSALRYFSNHMAKQDYLTEKGEVEMAWCGQGSERLGLSGQVNETDFARICDGLHPLTQDKLMVRNNGANRRVCYFGQISAPRDVSIAYLVGGDRRIAGWWQESVKETLREIEGVTATRVHEGNKVRDRPSEMVAALVRLRQLRWEVVVLCCLS
jgi:conjugative relaxase-like TrwC/TraI family protein